jgi:hypothetical protein
MTRTLIKKAEASVKKTEAVFWPRVTAFSELSAGDAPSAFLFKTIDQRKLPPDIDFGSCRVLGSFEFLATDLRRDSLNRVIRVFQHVSL